MIEESMSKMTLLSGIDKNCTENKEDPTRAVTSTSIVVRAKTPILAGSRITNRGRRFSSISESLFIPNPSDTSSCQHIALALDASQA